MAVLESGSSFAPPVQASVKLYPGYCGSDEGGGASVQLSLEPVGSPGRELVWTADSCVDVSVPVLGWEGRENDIRAVLDRELSNFIKIDGYVATTIHILFHAFERC